MSFEFPLPVVEVEVGQGHPRGKAEGSEVGVHSVPRAAGRAFSKNHVIDLRILEELTKQSTSGLKHPYLFFWVVLVLEHARQVEAEVSSRVLEAVEEEAERVRAPALQALRQLEQIMLDQTLARVQMC